MQDTITKVEYRIREVKRYVVTRYEWETDGASGTNPQGRSTQHGTFDNGEVAYQVAYALCRQEHHLSGEPIDSMNFKYPEIPDGVSIPPLAG